MRKKLILYCIIYALILNGCSYADSKGDTYNHDIPLIESDKDFDNFSNQSKLDISEYENTNELKIDNNNFIIDTYEMIQNLNTLCESPRKFGTEGEDRAAEFLTNKLINYGYVSELQYFNVYNRNILDAIHAPSISEYFQIDKDELLGKAKNIVTLSNNKDKRDLYLVAHYDTTKNSIGSADNGSGVIVVLEVAKQLQKIVLPFNVKVVFFSAEEFALQGSTYFISKMSKNEKENSIGCINIDLVGQVGEPEIMLKTITNQINVLSILIDKYHDFKHEFGSASDHRSFYMGGIPVVYFGDNINNKIEDNSPVDSVDINKLKELTEILCEFISNLDLNEYNDLLKNSYSESYTIIDGQIEILGYTLTEAKEILKEDGSGSKQQYKLSSDNGSNIIITEEDNRFVDMNSTNITAKYHLYEDQIKYTTIQDNSDELIIYYQDLFTSNNYGKLEGEIDLNTALELIKNRDLLINNKIQWYEQKADR